MCHYLRLCLPWELWYSDRGCDGHAPFNALPCSSINLTTCVLVAFYSLVFVMSVWDDRLPSVSFQLVISAFRPLRLTLRIFFVWLSLLCEGGSVVGGGTKSSPLFVFCIMLMIYIYIFFPVASSPFFFSAIFVFSQGKVDLCVGTKLAIHCRCCALCFTWYYQQDSLGKEESILIVVTFECFFPPRLFDDFPSPLVFDKYCVFSYVVFFSEI